ncbi:MAG TPA: TRAP transporter substrate-binding protein DctP [Gammaproteobacteria bacterium]|nr:TRAP transporter substrate-binding protein DctP [Gammaproteobacteria bacterium]
MKTGRLLLACILWVATQSVWAAETAQAVELKIATLAPDSTTWMKEMRAGAAEIEGKTAGRVKFKFYPGAVMGNDEAVLRKIRIGQLQGGAITAGTLAGIYPDAQVYSLPLQIQTIEEVNYVRQHMDDKLRAGAAGHGMEVVGISNGGFAYLAGSKPITSIASLKDQRTWVPEGDRVSATMFKAAGISPTPLPMADVYTALQTGLLDVVASNPSSLIAFQWHTKIKYITDVPMVFLVGMLVIDKRAFDRLQPPDQAIVREVMAAKFRKLDELNEQDNTEARRALEAGGIEFVKPSAEEKQAWQQIADSTLKELEQAGAYSKETLQELQKHLAAFRAGNKQQK